jgi:AAA15 family ATPase/GTPase
MDDQFLKNIKIINYKSFLNLNSGKGIDLAVPDLTNKGSGLTILIGKNSSGKTSVASALTKLKNGSYLFDSEKAVITEEVKIIFENCNGKILTLQNNAGGNDLSSSGEYGLSYEMLDIIKDNRIWNATFSSPDGYLHSSLTGDMNFDRSVIENGTARRLAVIKKHEPVQKAEIDKILKRIAPDFIGWEIKAERSGGNTSEYIAYEVASGHKLSIDLSLGSGVLNLFRIALSLTADSKIVFIDEPEAFLHPTAQIELCKILAEAATNRQIIISTHSPYMFRDAVASDAYLYIFEKTQGATTIRDLRELGTGLFGPISPTWGEINYFAYDLPSVEFHNELYGYIQAKAIDNDAQNSYEANFDSYLNTEASIAQDRPWIPEKEGKPLAATTRTLATYIRNTIHHPENTRNKPYDEALLRESTEQLVEHLRTLI